MTFLTNLFSPGAQAAMQEVKKWAQAEIGLPPIAVVGGWNDAYPNMVKLTRWDFRVPAAYPGEKEIPRLWRATKRATRKEACNGQGQCSMHYFRLV